MRRTGWALVSVATATLTAGSMAAVAATTGSSAPVGPDGGGIGRTASAGCPPSSLPGATVDVTLTDMGASTMGGGTMGAGMQGRGWGRGGWMALADSPASVPGGRVSLVARNRGALAHELVVLPLAAASSVGQRRVRAGGTVSEAGRLGEASRGCRSGAGSGIAPGQAGWVTLSLRPGRYELVCNLPGHYRAGMYAELDVT